MREPTFEEACALTAGAAMWKSLAVPEAGIPAFTMGDGPMGIASGNVDERDVSLLSPCPTAIGASWDPEIARKVGEVIGSDAVERGIDAVLAPNLNLARSPLAGRAFEYFSEDPLLTGVMGAAWIAGLQSTGTGSVAKHLVCNDSETERDRVDVQVDERTLREVYLLPFELAAKAGCAGMLAAYNRLNGDWCSESTPVLSGIVKHEWGFDRLIMSDWFGTHSGAGCINAGLDLEMPGPARFMGAKLAEADGTDRLRVFDAAQRVAATARMVTGPKASPLPFAKAQAVLKQAAAAGFVLLKNEGDLLPLPPGSVKRIAVIGPNAAAPCFQGGTFAKIAVAPETPTPIEAIRARYGAETEIVFEPGVDPQPRLPAMPMPMTVDYFASPDCAGDPHFSEQRTTNSLVWFQGQHSQGQFDVPGSVRASGTFTAQGDGVHRFYLGATGTARVLVDGHELLKAGGQIEAKDVMGVLKRGDADVAELALEAGQQVRVTVEFSYTGARCQGLWYGIRAPDSPEAMLARAVEAARGADAVFLIVGETSDNSVESKDRPDTRLASGQIALIEAVTAANPRTAVIANVGHAFDTSWDEQTAALMLVWYPGQGFADALASVLSGDAEPGGRMPVSIAMAEADYPGLSTKPDAEGQLAYAEGLGIGWRGLAANETAPRHALGSGMGYARFVWSNMSAVKDGVAVTVRNVSHRAGGEVVQLYRDAPEPALVGFAKVRLEPGEERRVTVPIVPEAMRAWDSTWRDLPKPWQLRLARDCSDPGTAVTV
jgi:beta-glucosidase